MITTRTATNDDKEFLRNLKFVSMRQYVELIYGWDDEVQNNYFEQSFYPNKIQIIQFDNQDVGMYKLQERAEEWFLARIEILPFFQGKGIGTIIIQRMLDLVSKKGKPVRLQVLKINPAQNFYQRNGFVRTGETATHITFKFQQNTD